MSHLIGIDVSKATLDCAYLRNPDQDKAKRKSCQNEVCCFESLIAWAEAFSGLPRQSLAFVIEPTNVYHEQLVQFLHSQGTTVYLVNPGRVRKFAEGIDNRTLHLVLGAAGIDNGIASPCNGFSLASALTYS